MAAGGFDTRQSFATRKPLIRRDRQFVTRLTVCATVNGGFLEGRQAADGPLCDTRRAKMPAK
jgi:hypothetical protein